MDWWEASNPDDTKEHQAYRDIEDSDAEEILCVIFALTLSDSCLGSQDRTNGIVETAKRFRKEKI